ncbi:hypothetical protein ACS0TY_036309 [Phlomoides rotata]
MNRGRGSNRGGGGDGGKYASRGRSSRSADHYVARRVPVGSGARSAGASSGSESSEGGRKNPDTTSIVGVTKEFDRLLSSDFPHRPSSEPRLVQSATEAEPTTPLNVTSVSPCYENYSPLSSTPSEQNAGGLKIIESYFSSTPHVNSSHKKKEPSQSTGGQFHKEVQSGKTESEGTSARNELENSDSQNKEFSFDICEERNKSLPKLKTSLLVKNKAIRDEKKRQNQGDNIQVVRPGMMLLKGYVSIMDQVKLIKSCRDLGRGPGGFYQPGYRDGARLHLKMMCLGKNWDPETSWYDEIRPIDQAKPPPIPDEFQQLVKGVLQKCHAHLESDSKLRNAKNSFPSMSPNICVVNFYTQTGKLGLHQDKDESPESLRKGLPVVSISLGDSAEFLYGDQRDIDKAGKVVLESGDVLIFGGESRLIFHGVSSIKPGTAPNPLLEETDLRPGRLNLTFREY